MGTDSVIYIRTDGNPKIATGHLVRCLCIAQALEELGKKVCFLVSDSISLASLQELSNSIFCDIPFSYESKILESAVYDNLDLELDELCTLLDKDKDDFAKPTILIDSYYVTDAYLTMLRKFATTVYMDDLRSFDYVVDYVINYDVIPPSKLEEYQQSYTLAKNTLLGAAYTPLRKQFQNQDIIYKKDIRTLLITTGGSDPYDFTPELLTRLISSNLSFDIHVVIGKFFKNTALLEDFAIKYPFIHLHRDVSNMATLMKQCEFAISAAGTTLYELCALGIPAISISMADNQIPMAQTFAETDAIPYAGDIRSQNVYATILHYLSLITKDISICHKQQKTMHELVDGNGAIKIAKIITHMKA